MRAPDIPQRIPPLSWRKPALLWTPLALALAVGWPVALFYQSMPLLRLTLSAGAMVFALALVSLGASWALVRPPRTRRSVVLHVLFAGVIAALVGPFVLSTVLAALGGEQTLTTAMAMAMTPLSLVLGPPALLISGTLFAFVALVRSPAPGTVLDDGFARPHEVQPFR